jgi:thymidylate kinase
MEIEDGNLRDRAMLIVFTGMDGSGKSLQAKALTASLGDEGISCVYVWNRWSPFLLRPIIRLGRWILGRVGESEDEQYRSFQGGKQRVFRRSLFANTWKNLALLDYWLQVSRNIRGHSRSGKLVVCDRYLMDFLVDLSNNFGYGEGEIHRLFQSRLLSLFPRPDVTFLLDLPAEVAFQRKEDVSLSYLQDRRVLYLTFGRIQGAEILDATASIPDLKEIIRRTSLELVGGGKASSLKKSSSSV